MRRGPASYRIRCPKHGLIRRRATARPEYCPVCGRAVEPVAWLRCIVVLRQGIRRLLPSRRELRRPTVRSARAGRKPEAKPVEKRKQAALPPEWHAAFVIATGFRSAEERLAHWQAVVENPPAGEITARQALLIAAHTGDMDHLTYEHRRVRGESVQQPREEVLHLLRPHVSRSVCNQENR